MIESVAHGLRPLWWLIIGYVACFFPVIVFQMAAELIDPGRPHWSIVCGGLLVLAVIELSWLGHMFPRFVRSLSDAYSAPRSARAGGPLRHRP